MVARHRGKVGEGRAGDLVKPSLVDFHVKALASGVVRLRILSGDGEVLVEAVLRPDVAERLGAALVSVAHAAVPLRKAGRR